MLSIDKQVVRRKKRHHKKIPKFGSGPIFLGLIVLSVLLALILISKLFGLIDHLQQPFSPDDSLASQKISWNSQYNLYLAVKAEKTYLLSFNPVEKSLMIYQVPDDLQVPLPFSFGHWLMGSVYKLGQGEEKPMGAKLLQDTLTINFGLPVEHYWIINSKTAFPELISQFKGNPLSAWLILSESKTNLSAVELVRLWWGLKSVRQDKIKTVDLTQTPATSWQLLPDGSRVLGVNQIQLDQLIRTQLEDEQMKKEGKTLGFYNATEYPGLADRAARLTANLGGRVIFTANFNQSLKKTIILGPESYTIFLLAKIFAPEEKLNCQKNFCQSGNNQDLQIDYNRAEINVFLGEDYYQRFNQLPE